MNANGHGVAEARGRKPAKLETNLERPSDTLVVRGCTNEVHRKNCRFTQHSLLRWPAESCTASQAAASGMPVSVWLALGAARLKTVQFRLVRAAAFDAGRRDCFAQGAARLKSV